MRRLLPVAALTLLVAACGGSDSGDGATGASAPAATAPATTAPATNAETAPATLADVRAEVVAEGLDAPLLARRSPAAPTVRSRVDAVDEPGALPDGSGDTERQVLGELERFEMIEHDRLERFVAQSLQGGAHH